MSIGFKRVKENLKRVAPSLIKTAIIGGALYYFLKDDDEQVQRTYFVFISHCWDYNDQYKRIKSLLEDNDNFNWNDYSIPVQKAFPKMSESELSKRIESKIKRSHCIIFIAGMYFSHRKWMEEELRMAKRNNIPVICLVPWGKEKIPKLLKEEADAIVGWNSGPLINKIIELTNFRT